MNSDGKRHAELRVDDKNTRSKLEIWSKKKQQELITLKNKDITYEIRDQTQNITSKCQATVLNSRVNLWSGII